MSSTPSLAGIMIRPNDKIFCSSIPKLLQLVDGGKAHLRVFDPDCYVVYHGAFHFFSPPDISAKDVGIAGFAASANLVVLMKVRKNTG